MEARAASTSSAGTRKSCAGSSIRSVLRECGAGALALCGHRLEELRLTFLNLGGGQVFLTSRERPAVTERVGDGAEPIAPELIADLHRGFRPRCHRPIVKRIAVWCQNRIEENRQGIAVFVRVEEGLYEGDLGAYKRSEHGPSVGIRGMKGSDAPRRPFGRKIRRACAADVDGPAAGALSGRPRARGPAAQFVARLAARARSRELEAASHLDVARSRARRRGPGLGRILRRRARAGVAQRALRWRRVRPCRHDRHRRRSPPRALGSSARPPFLATCLSTGAQFVATSSQAFRLIAFA